MKVRNSVLPLILLSGFVTFAATSGRLSAQVLVGDPYIDSYQGWIDPAPERGGNWRLSMYNPTLMETSDQIPTGNNPPAATNNGSYVPSLLIQNDFLSPATYDLNARMYSSDDDGWGLVFGYENPENYFRVFLRGQANGNLGGTFGLSVQKVVDGVATQINPAGAGEGFPIFGSPPDFTPFDTRAPHDITVAVDGNNYEVYVAGANGDQAIWRGSDSDLGPGKIGVQSWAQRNRTGNQPHWGTEVESISVSDDSGPLYSGAFSTMPVAWRPLYMANTIGVRTSDPITTPAVIVGDDRGNFGLDINDPWIYQQTNGFEWATEEKPNIDFLGPAIVVDEPGSESFSDYEMRVRLGAVDDDGLGVLVRVQDDDNFYRINFTNQALGDPQLPHERAPQGMSVQKVKDGVWTELFRDDQTNPLFVYDASGVTGDTPGSDPVLPTFDLKVRAIGNELSIQVIDGVGNVIDYPTIVDSADPLLTGTIGLATWGNDHVYFTRYGGEVGPLLTAIPEPSAAVLGLLGVIGGGALVRRRK